MSRRKLTEKKKKEIWAALDQVEKKILPYGSHSLSVSQHLAELKKHCLKEIVPLLEKADTKEVLAVIRAWRKHRSEVITTGLKQLIEFFSRKDLSLEQKAASLFLGYERFLERKRVRTIIEEAKKELAKKEKKKGVRFSKRRTV